MGQKAGRQACYHRNAGIRNTCKSVLQNHLDGCIDKLLSANAAHPLFWHSCFLHPKDHHIFIVVVNNKNMMDAMMIFKIKCVFDGS